MGFFSKSESNSTFPWKVLNSIEQLESLWNDSENKNILIFKHSTRCSISSMVKNNFEKKWNIPADKCEIYYLDLIQFRDVSNRIESLTGVIHQSPQTIVFKNKQVLYNDSHNGIDVNEIETIL